MNKRPPLRRSAPVEQENDGVIEGRNAVIEALRAGVAIDKIFIARGETDSALGHIASTAREKGVVVSAIMARRGRCRAASAASSSTRLPAASTVAR